MSGCPLDQAFGTMNDIKIKKKSKSKKADDIIYPEELKKVEHRKEPTEYIRGYDKKEDYDNAYISPNNGNYSSHNIEEHILCNQFHNSQPTPQFVERRNQKQTDINERKNISDKEYEEFKMFQKMRYMYLKNSSVEGFRNANDEFNDVLLFALTGIFFLIFIDYIYKLGKKSY